MGIGFSLSVPYGDLKLPSWAQLFVATTDGDGKLDFAWSSEKPSL